MSKKDLIIKGAREHNLKNVDVTVPRDERARIIKELTNEMKEAAKILEFEHAAFLRDKIEKLKSIM